MTPPIIALRFTIVSGVTHPTNINNSAIHQLAQTGKPVQLGTFERQHRPGAEQIIGHPASEQEPELVHAANPSGKS